MATETGQGQPKAGKGSVGVDRMGYAIRGFWNFKQDPGEVDLDIRALKNFCILEKNI